MQIKQFLSYCGGLSLNAPPPTLPATNSSSRPAGSSPPPKRRLLHLRLLPPPHPRLLGHGRHAVVLHLAGLRVRDVREGSDTGSGRRRLVRGIEGCCSIRGFPEFVKALAETGWLDVGEKGLLKEEGMVSRGVGEGVCLG